MHPNINANTFIYNKYQTVKKPGLLQRGSLTKTTKVAVEVFNLLPLLHQILVI
jgi:hypothetical protein